MNPRKLSQRTVLLLLQGTSVTGNCLDGYYAVIEEIYVNEADELLQFCQWSVNKYGFLGRANIQMQWREYNNLATSEDLAYLQETKEFLADLP